MKKYLTIFETQLSIYFAYKLSFILWRVRNILNLILIYFLWLAVFSVKTQAFSYTQERMVTYVMLVGIMNAVVMSTRTGEISNYIVNGEIMQYLLKPFPFLSVVIIREFADKAINICFSIVEIIILILILKPTVFLQTNAEIFFFFLISVIVGCCISFFLSFLLSLIAFWSSQVWAPRFIYFILISVFAGTAFPLDILPKQLYNALLVTPFPYLIYLPIKIYIDGVQPNTVGLLSIGILWSIVFYILAKIVWTKGIKEFSFYGR